MQMSFWQLRLFFVLKLVVILLLVVGGSEAFLPMPPPWPELPYSWYKSYNPRAVNVFRTAFTSGSKYCSQSLRISFPVCYARAHAHSAKQVENTCHCVCVLYWEVIQHDLFLIFPSCGSPSKSNSTVWRVF